MLLTGCEIIMEVLAEQGVDTVFGYPGGQVLNIYDLTDSTPLAITGISDISDDT